ncbi:hypothetical protein LCL95_01510 [Bacillus timonensis]|nr:hypothetical protein [Bacillus timonensis]
MKQYRIGLLIILLGVGIILALFIGRNTVYDGSFIKTGHSSIDLNLSEIKEKKIVYLGYDMKWQGSGTPVIKYIQFIKSDGTKLTEEDTHLAITPYFSDQPIGSYYEEDAKKEGILEHLYPVKQFQLEEDEFYLVLKLELKEEPYENNLEELVITYEKWGFQQEQRMEFEGVFTEIGE